MADPNTALGNQTANREPPPLNGTNGQDRIQPVSDVHIDVEVEDRLFRTIKRRLFPQEIEGILWQAQTGDLYWQEQLWSVMVDKWYRLATNLKKLRMEVQAFEFEFQPWSNKNEKPSRKALDKANFCEQAFFGMSSNVAWQEHNFLETVGDLVDGLISGFMVCEVYWESRTGLGIVPRSTRWIPARYYRYPYVMDAIDRLMLNPSGMLGSTQLLDFPPGQFLVSIEQSHTNFPVFTAPFRPLCAWWVASQFGLEWLMQYAQIFGFPQRVGYYEPGDDQVKAELTNMMKRAQAATWGVFPKGTQVEITAHAQGSGPMPHERLVDLADRSCDIMLLGQTLTSDVERSGSRALGAVHKSVFDHIVEASAKSVCKKITTQIIPKLIELNFGDTDELPSLQPVIHTPIDSVQLATAYNIFFNTMRIPVSKKQLYDRIQFQEPEAGDEVYEPPPPAPKGGFGGGGFGGAPGGPPGAGVGPPGAGGMPTEEGAGTREPPISGERADGATGVSCNHGHGPGDFDPDDEIDPDDVLEGARHDRRHPKSGRFIPAARAPKRKVLRRPPAVAEPEEAGEPPGEIAPEVVERIRQRMGVKVCKKNVDQGDDKVCPACKEITAEGWIPAEKLFLGFSARAPHHPNCRCETEYETVRVNIHHQTASGNPYHHPKTGQFVAKTVRATGEEQE